MRALQRFKPVLLIFFVIAAICPVLAAADQFNITTEGIILSGVPFSLQIEAGGRFAGQDFRIYGLKDGTQDGKSVDGRLEISGLRLAKAGERELRFEVSGQEFRKMLRVVPGWLALLPPLTAILLALITKEMLLSLFFGIWSGVTILYGYNPVHGFFSALDTYIVNSLANPGHASIIIFSLMFGGMIGIFSKNGGMQGIVDAASKLAKTRRSGQLATSLMGVLIFFDDYANTLLVGNTMRPFTDKLRISREKLSYIVDSTAAPVANLAFISTWSVFQMSLLDVPYANAGISVSPYITFLKSIPYGFYSIFALWLLFWLGITRRDYGGMYRAEIRAVRYNLLLNEGASPLMDDSLMENGNINKRGSHWLNAVIPIVVVILTTMIGLYVTGLRNIGEGERSFRIIIGNSDSYASLMWGAALGGVVALILSLTQKLLNLKDTVNAWLAGVRSMVLAAIVLTLAWSLGQVCEDLMTAEYIIHHAQSIISLSILPLLTFILAALISFATGTSWGTMSILVPLVIPLAIKMTNGNVDSQVFLASFAAVLSGATFGDHCSPISDTTILSSMASGSDHIDHVKTQIPYAITAALFAAIFGFFPAGLKIQGFWIVIPTLLMIVLFVRFVGKKVDVVSEEESAT